jgi:multidrug efflux pump subunit AcrA (membrane-fusion protein)
MDTAKLQSIRIPDTQRRRSQGAFWWIVLLVLAITIGSLLVAKPWKGDERDADPSQPAITSTEKAAPQSPAPPPKPRADAKPGDVLLTVSGYIINRERIEVSPRVMNQVIWIGVKKGDRVKKDQVVVQLDDSEQKARGPSRKSRWSVRRSISSASKNSAPRKTKRRSAKTKPASQSPARKRKSSNSRAHARPHKSSSIGR